MPFFDTDSFCACIRIFEKEKLHQYYFREAENFRKALLYPKH